MKNKTESKLSRKSVFGSLWRWVKGKIASSCKLSLSISSDISNEKKKKKIDELVKKIQGWDISYYPGDRINAILDLGAESTDRKGQSTKITWDDLDDDKQEIVLTKLVGFLNRICYGDYTGGPSSNSKREKFMVSVSSQDKNPVLQKIQIGWYTTDKQTIKDGKWVLSSQYTNRKKITNGSFHHEGANVWCCLVETKKNKYEDGMGGNYFELIKDCAKPVKVNTTTFLSSMDKEIDLYMIQMTY